jgi:hypothetical protein
MSHTRIPLSVNVNMAFVNGRKNYKASTWRNSFLTLAQTLAPKGLVQKMPSLDFIDSNT